MQHWRAIQWLETHQPQAGHVSERHNRSRFLLSSSGLLSPASLR